MYPRPVVTLHSNSSAVMAPTTKQTLILIQGGGRGGLEAPGWTPPPMWGSMGWTQNPGPRRSAGDLAKISEKVRIVFLESVQ